MNLVQFVGKMVPFSETSRQLPEQYNVEKLTACKTVSMLVFIERINVD